MCRRDVGRATNDTPEKDGATLRKGERGGKAEQTFDGRERPALHYENKELQNMRNKSRNMPLPDKLPALGTREAAFKACVSMIARLCGQPVETVQYWLDLYYQVRLAWAVDEEHRRAAERLEYCRKIQVEPIGPSEGEEQGAEDAAPETPAVEPKAEQEPVAERSVTPPPVEPVSELEGFELVAAAPKKQGAPKGNTNGADAAKFKRETLERLRKMRQGGLTIAQIVSVSNGSIKEDSVLDILAAKRVPISDYRKLAAALDEIEE